ncbi:hypothetical protein SMALB_0103 [Streptomyces malaysiensis]|uniref:Uncharacterized protein n=1 Tax=Streptomyces malaysiensis TaxID=92644 RepID=A0A7X5WWB2_STRMQ|nr:hypothetical protein [Streptomyces malaysiensis]
MRMVSGRSVQDLRRTAPDGRASSSPCSSRRRMRRVLPHTASASIIAKFPAPLAPRPPETTIAGPGEYHSPATNPPGRPAGPELLRELGDSPCGSLGRAAPRRPRDLDRGRKARAAGPCRPAGLVGGQGLLVARRRGLPRTDRRLRHWQGRRGVRALVGRGG